MDDMQNIGTIRIAETGFWCQFPQGSFSILILDVNVQVLGEISARVSIFAPALSPPPSFGTLMAPACNGFLWPMHVLGVLRLKPEQTLVCNGLQNHRVVFLKASFQLVLDTCLGEQDFCTGSKVPKSCRLDYPVSQFLLACISGMTA